MKFLKNIPIVFALLTQCFSAVLSVDYICSSEIQIAGEILNTEISPDGKNLVVFAAEIDVYVGKLIFYDLQNSDWVEIRSLGVNNIVSYALSPDWQALATIEKNGPLKLFIRNNNDWHESLVVDYVKNYQFSLQEQAIFALTNGNQLQRYTCLEDGSWVRDLSFCIENIESFQLFYNFFIVSLSPTEHIVYKYEHGNLARILEVDNCYSYHVSCDEQYLLIEFENENDELIVYKQECGFFREVNKINDVASYQFAPNREVIAALNEGAELFLYEKINGNCEENIYTWKKNPCSIENVYRYTFSPSGNSLIIVIRASEDNEKPLMVLYVKHEGNWISDLEIAGLSGDVFFYNDQSFGIHDRSKNMILISKQDNLWCKALELKNVSQYLQPSELLLSCVMDEKRFCVFENRDNTFIGSFELEIEKVNKMQSFASGRKIMLTTCVDNGISKLIIFTQRSSCKSSRAITAPNFQEEDSNKVENVKILGKRDLSMRTIDTKTRGQKPARKQRFLDLSNDNL